jgi:DNA-binding IclR family transcriptional regulator
MRLPAQPNQSLIDGLSVLQALASAGRPVGSREMARLLSLEPTRVNRLLKTLSATGVARQREDRRYEPGPGMHVLAAQSMFGSGLLRLALPILETLRKRDLSVAIGVLWRRHVAYLVHALPRQPIAAGLGRAGLYPAEQSSIGIVLLASQRDADIRACFGNDTPPWRDIRAARKNGYALLHPAEREDTLAVAIGAASPYAGIALAGPIDDHRAAELLPALRDAARRIESFNHQPKEIVP